MTWPSLDQGRPVSGWGSPTAHLSRRKETWFGGDLDFIFVIIFPHFFSLSLQKLAIWVSTFAILTASPSSYPWFGELRLDQVTGRFSPDRSSENHWGGRDESEKSVETKLLSLVSLVFSFCFRTIYRKWYHFGSLSDPSRVPGFVDCILATRGASVQICAQTTCPHSFTKGKHKTSELVPAVDSGKRFVAETAPSLDPDLRAVAQLGSHLFKKNLSEPYRLRPR